MFEATNGVSIHASAREATKSGLPDAFIKLFQSTPPRGRRRNAALPRRRNSACFNPRLRAGGDAACIRTGRGYRGFNPRLRAGGDQGLVGVVQLFGQVSIHASAREATAAPWACRCGQGSFNPRLRAGGDQNAKAKKSINPCFNPRLRAGGDAKEPGQGRAYFCFNPRLRAGGD